jgi:hypothetical protein
LSRSSIDFPEKLCKAIAKLTDDFSFAFLQEAFVATLLVLARSADDGEEGKGSCMSGDRAPEKLDAGDDDDGLTSYKFYRVIKQQIKILREDLDSGSSSTGSATGPCDDAPLSWVRENTERLGAGREDGVQAQTSPFGADAGSFLGTRLRQSPGEASSLMQRQHEDDGAIGRSAVPCRKPTDVVSGSRWDAQAARASMAKISFWNQSSFEWGPREGGQSGIVPDQYLDNAEKSREY